MDIINIANIKKFLIDKETLARIEFLDKAKDESINSIDMNIVKKLIGDVKISDPCILGKDVIHDIELVESYEKNGTCVIDSIGQLYLCGSKQYLKTILENPIQSFKKLKTRQEIIKYYKETLEDNESFRHIESCFDKMKKTEKDILWLYEDDHTELNSLYELVYFSSFLTRPLNSYPIALSSYNIYRIVVSPLVGILTPILYVLIPYIIIRIKLKLNLSLMTFVRLMFKGMLRPDIGWFNSSFSKLNYLKYVSFAFSILFYFQGMFNSVEISRSSYSIIKTITSRMKSVVNFIKSGHDLVKSYWHSKISPAFLQDNMHLTDEDIYFDKIDNIKNTHFMFTNFGYYLNIYKFMDKASYIPLIKMVYMIDALMSAAKLIISSECQLTYFDFSTNKKTLDLTDFYHPCLKESAIKNSLDITNNVIITGPNAGGKSTTIKSILIAVILSQTLTLSHGKCHLTPFYFINSQINIPDCKGQESLFEAEMHRSRSNFKILSEIPDDRSSLIVMDELFNSTNPIEGIAGAYAILDKLASYPYNISLVTTHYLYLTKLSKSNKFMNYKMNVNISYTSPDIVDDIQYPYILQKGVSKQYIALELLKRNGFDEDIIENAMRIKQDILGINKKPIVFKTENISCDSTI